MDLSLTSVESDHARYNLNVIPQVREALEYIYGGLRHIPFPTSLTSYSSYLQGCLPLLMEEISAETLIQLIGQKKYQQLRSLHHQSTLLNLWYELELKNVLEAITGNHIPVVILKGADIASSLYPRLGLRYFGDIDLIVQPEDLAATTGIFERLGYHYHQEYRFESISKQRAGYVYVKEVTVGYLMFEIHTSLHSNEMGISFDLIQIWTRARPITVAGVNARGMGLEDLLLYLCWHYRSHAFNRLIWLYDIARLLLQHADTLNWTLVQQLAQRQGLEATVYYCICWCQRMFHIPLPESLQLKQFMPPVFIQRLITSVVGDESVAVLRRSAQRERKLLQRLMVDDMQTLCLVIMRILFPSSSHLGRLYMEHSHLPLRLFWLYYPLHPLFLLRGYFRNRHN